MRIILASCILSVNFFLLVHAVEDEVAEIEKADPFLEKVERWIRYILQTGVSFGPGQPDSFLPPKIYRSSGLRLFDEFVGGKCFANDNENDHLPNLWQHLEHLEQHFGAFFGDQSPIWMRSWTIGDNIKYDITEWFLTTQHEPGQLGQFMSYLGAILGENGDQPNWMRTLSKISDLTGWQHFWAFNAVFQKIANGISDENYAILFGKLLSFETRTEIDMAKIEKSLVELGQTHLDDLQKAALNTVYERGQQLTRPLLLMVLYRTLLRAFGDDISPTECHEGMPRRDYVVYWLRKMYESLKRNYEENLTKFLESLHPKLEYNQQILDLFSVWAKYVSYWDLLLEIVGKQGLQQLDPTIDLFEPPPNDV